MFVSRIRLSGWSSWSSRPGGRRPLRLVLLAALVATLLPPSPASPLAPRPAAAATTVTTTAALNLRSSANLDASVRLVMPAGASVSVTGDPWGGFFPVTYAGTSGWAAGDYLRFPVTTAATTDYLNLRAGAWIGATVLTVMPPRAAVTLTGRAAGDYLGVTYQGRTGWAAAAYLDIVGSGGGGSSGGSATTTDALNLRASASLGARVLFVMPAGAIVTLTGERANGFAQVIYQGTRGWASTSYLATGSVPAPAPSPAPGGAPSNPSGYARPAPGSGIAIVTDDLNLRAAAGTGSAVRAVMPAGSRVTLTGVAQNGFYLVVYRGSQGWASTQYLLGGGRPPDNYGYTQAQIESFIVTAAERYGQDPNAMLRVANCESNLVSTAVNPAGSYGIFQFVRSTWDSTPYAHLDIFEAWANANAAAWMWSVGRRHEWVCQ